MIRKTVFGSGIAVGLSALIAWSSWQPVHTTKITRSAVAQRAVAADFAAERPGPSARYMGDWIVRTNDAASGPFLIVDKADARIYVFDANGRLRGAAPALLGAAIGDDTVPGIGDRPIPEVRPEERTTPAGRFVGELGRNARDEDVVWVDYDAAVSIHRVLTTNPKERRLERLATPSVDDNRISYGCINVGREFYEAYVQPIFARGHANIYILPEVRPLASVFALDLAADVH